MREYAGNIMRWQGGKRNLVPQLSRKNSEKSFEECHGKSENLKMSKLKFGNVVLIGETYFLKFPTLCLF